jgi:uncharacterized phiE125 gp8 family phage protein
VLVTPAIAIVSSSIANPTVLTTATPHGLATGDTVTVAGHSGSTPAVSGTYTATVLSPTTLSVPVNVTVAGTGGTVTRAAAAPVLTLADAKLHTRLDPNVTTEDVAVMNWVRAATLQVEKETGVELLAKTYDVTGSAFPGYNGTITLPFGPLLAVTSITTIDSAAAPHIFAAADVVADTASIPGRIGLVDAGYWPTDLRWFDPITIRVIVGHASIALVPEPLLQAVRLAVAWHSANREPSAIERGSYDWLIGLYQSVTVA